MDFKHNFKTHEKKERKARILNYQVKVGPLLAKIVKFPTPHPKKKWKKDPEICTRLGQV